MAYRSDSVKPHHRTAELGESRLQFTNCEHCGFDSQHFGIKYYHRYGMILCDRCIDKANSFSGGRDIDEYWTDEDAARDGFKPFPLPPPVIIEKNRTEAKNLRDSKYASND